MRGVGAAGGGGGVAWEAVACQHWRSVSRFVGTAPAETGAAQSERVVHGGWRQCGGRGSSVPASAEFESLRQDRSCRNGRGAVRKSRARSNRRHRQRGWAIEHGKDCLSHAHAGCTSATAKSSRPREWSRPSRHSPSLTRMRDATRMRGQGQRRGSAHRCHWQ